jgi:hypothetical protein
MSAAAESNITGSQRQLEVKHNWKSNMFDGKRHAASNHCGLQE